MHPFLDQSPQPWGGDATRLVGLGETLILMDNTWFLPRLGGRRAGHIFPGPGVQDSGEGWGEVITKGYASGSDEDSQRRGHWSWALRDD